VRLLQVCYIELFPAELLAYEYHQRWEVENTITRHMLMEAKLLFVLGIPWVVLHSNDIKLILNRQRGVVVMNEIPNSSNMAIKFLGKRCSFSD